MIERKTSLRTGGEMMKSSRSAQTGVNRIERLPQARHTERDGAVLLPGYS
ncbi:hypothetical protein [Paenibacillus ihumii]|nr:hypothetical protein [Paenibacillus ihumii]